MTMTTSPQVSVVMAVYNGEQTLADTLESILTQQGVDFECIVVNDGSTDLSRDILQHYSEKDTRLRVIEQDNQGLTRSLIRGCAEARGEFIARQDAGDVSLPGRIQKQSNFLHSHADFCMVSCGTRMVGLQGEELQIVQQTEEDAEQGLHRLALAEICGPSHHGSVMFRRNLYNRVGGYRFQFAVAQDLDLWIRLAEHGRHWAVQEVLYQAALTPGSISMVNRDQQLVSAQFIIEAARLRRAGKSEQQILDNAVAFSAREANTRKQGNVANGYYFLGCCLLRRDPVAARSYFQSARQADPLHFKAWFRLLQTWFSA